MTKGEAGPTNQEEIRALASPLVDEPSAILGSALDILAGVRRLLEALSPDDVQAMATRLHRGVEGQDEPHAIYWKVYAARHRVLVDVFSTQHTELVERAGAYTQLVRAAAERGDQP